MTQCEIVIRWSSEDEAFIAEVPELPGCMADGPTRQAALKNVDVVIKEWSRRPSRWAGRFPSRGAAVLLTLERSRH